MRIKLFSPVQEKLLFVFIGQPEEKRYINELIRLTQEYPNSIQYALKTLEKIDLLKSEYVNEKKFYWLNKLHPDLKLIGRIYNKKKISNSDNSQKESPWVKLLNREASLAFQVEVPLVNRDVLPKVIGCQINNFWCNGITYGVYYKESELRGLAETIQTQIKQSPKFAKKNIDDCYKLGNKLLESSNLKNPKSLNKLSDEQVLNLLCNFRTAYLNFLPYLVYPHSIERYFLTQINNELKDTLTSRGLLDKFEEYFQILTTPTIHEIEQQIDMLNLAYQLQKKGWIETIKKGLKELHQKYQWQPLFTITAKPLDSNYFKDAVEALSKSSKSLLKEVKRIQKEQKQRKDNLKHLLTLIKASKNLTDTVVLLQAYMFLRTYRKNIISNAHFLHLPLILEIGRRMKIGEDIKLVTYEEMIDFLTNKEIVSKITLEKRRHGWGVIAFNGVIKVVSGLDAVLEVMEQFQIGNNPIPESVHQVITGNPACRGKASGKVRIINDISELSKLINGDVLVTHMTTPDFVPCLRKVVAIITDEGGVTCHAAIVSREFGIPCIVGTTNATQVLRDGDEVEVNANKGIITITASKISESKDDLLIGKRLYKGRVRGDVVNIKSENDLKKVSVNSIVVASTISSRFLSALYKAKGFIIDEYSPTSHGYLYAQTLKMPALGGTKNASEILKTGDKIELNADKEFVKLL